MPLYHRLGKIPSKRHTIFKKQDGSLHYEQLFGTIGFDGMSSLMYHLHRPTMVKEVGKSLDVSPKAMVSHNIKSRLLKGFEVRPKDDYLESRTVLLFNSDVHVSLAAPKKSQTDYFYKNADADELLFVHKGTGVLKTMLGEIKFEYGIIY
jgi:homogentisate 1,2-dioxygenase